jgi:hypothetical protein
MLLYILIGLILWVLAFLVAILAGKVGSSILLVYDMIFAYYMCVRWFPIFPYKNDG